jgi:sugar O-acyltransferase (sialic acid O-acetyltransferase NeuD family)
MSGVPGRSVSARLILWGASGQAKVIREALIGTGAEITAVFDNDENATSPFPGVPIFHGWTGFGRWRQDTDADGYFAAVAIGGSHGRERVEIGQRLVREGLAPLTVVHPSAYVAGDAVLGEGCQVLASATVATEVRLGAWCIVNTAASIDHECVLGDGVHIGPGAHLAGCVEVGPGSMVGTGASIAPRVRIGADSIVGAGAVVLRDVAPGAVVVGNPARYLRPA